MDMNINPQKLMQMMMNNQFQSNPLFARAKEMANGKSENEIIETAKNLCKQKGLDFETEFTKFKNNFGL